MSGHAAFDQCSTFYSICIEDRKETKKMTRIIYNSIVKDDEILIRTSASDIKPRAAFAGILYPGKQLDCFKNIYFTQESWYGTKLFYGKIDLPHLGILHIRITTLSRYYYFIRRGGFWQEEKVVLFIGMKFKSLNLGLIANVRTYKFACTFR